MKMNSYNYTISPDQLDRGGLVTVPSMYRVVIDSIARNIRKEGFGVDVLDGHGLTWALARCAIEFFARPSLYEEISVEVWRGDSQGLCHNRCIKAVDSRGREICRGVTDWCVLDKSTRRPQPLLSQESDLVAQPCAAPRRLRPFTSLVKRTLEVGYSECDFNGHLNNVRYLELFFDMLPRTAVEMMKDFRLDINFRKEVPCGSLAESYIAENDSAGYDYCMYYAGSPACCASISTI